jgi:hypothetical protein
MVMEPVIVDGMDTLETHVNHAPDLMVFTAVVYVGVMEHVQPFT